MIRAQRTLPGFVRLMCPKPVQRKETISDFSKLPDFNAKGLLRCVVGLGLERLCGSEAAWVPDYRALYPRNDVEPEALWRKLSSESVWTCNI